MDRRISPRRLSGTVQPPPSKSVCHRALIAAALGSGVSRVFPVEPSADILATIRVLRAFGAGVLLEDGAAVVQGLAGRALPRAEADCGESGSTLRFCLPIAAALGTEASFFGSGKLPERPLTPYWEALPSKGISLDSKHLPLTVRGKLTPGRYCLPGNISSQFITGLLYALPLLDGPSEIVLTTELESAPYVDITLEVLAAYGIEVVKTPSGFSVPGPQRYKASDYRVEADYSAAAFFLTAGALSGEVTCLGLSENSMQGDRAIIPLLQKLGADIRREGGAVTVRASSLHGAEIDGGDIPDIVPILCVAAAAAQGETVIRHIKRLKIKECDRAAAMIDGLTRLGADIREEGDSLRIRGGVPLHGAVTEGWNDHRIAMCMAVAGLLCSGDTVIRGTECVKKSYPAFFEDYCMLGGKADVISLG
ncbi:MAG: 3-phosphoshikimate 1-carboxyvinyltransferase [Oscillospiraceae bacterium]|nr:3-phosphoshikimate 1-carboxyvinyltransferase [Oscillospiraceae bacterium]